MINIINISSNTMEFCNSIIIRKAIEIINVIVIKLKEIFEF